MVKERAVKTLYRDPQSGVLGGVCTGIAESLDVDVLLVRVATIVACVMTFGLAIVLYLVFWTILPVKVSLGPFVEVEPSRVRSELYGKVVNVRPDKAQPGKAEVKVFEQRSFPSVGRRKEPKSRESYHFSLLLLGIFFALVTVVIFCAITTSPDTDLATFAPLYFIPLGIFLVTIPSTTRPIAVRICAMVLCFEACFVCLPFTLGLCNYESFAALGEVGFLLWFISFIALFAAVVFQNTGCCVFAVALIFVAALVTFQNFGVIGPVVPFSFESLKSFTALGLLE